MKRKYLYEAGLGVYTSYKTIVPVERLDELAKIDFHKYHIYSILAYEQFYFKKERTYCNSQGIQVTIFTVINGEEMEYELPFWKWKDDVEISAEQIEIELNMPYTSMKIKFRDERILSEHPEYKACEEALYAQDLMLMYASELFEKTVFKVLYIGQAFGRMGERTAFNRLSSHSTLQKILTECQSKYADKHIYILLMEFTPQLLSVFDGISKEYTMTEEESDKHMHDVLCNLPQEQQVINITEAALINYFKPEYNTNYVESFPNENHKGYRQYFDLDYNSLCVEIDLEFDGLNLVQLYSDVNKITTSFDFIEYQLYNDNNRLSMYDVFRSKEC